MGALEQWMRRRRHRLLTGGSSEPENVIDKYTWDLAWDSKDATDTEWSGLAGTSTPTAPALATPTRNLSTTGFDPVGIGASRVDKAIRANASGGFAVTGQDWPGGVWHLRLLIRKVAWASTNEFFFRAYKDGDERVDLEIYSANALRLSVDDTGSAALFQAVGVAMADGPRLVDIVYDPTGAPGGFGRAVFRNNGTETTRDDNESLDFADVGGVGFYPAGGATNAMSRSSMLFLGVRFLLSASEFTLAAHTADLEALGL